MAKMKKCPVCGIGVKLENLETHLKKVHPRVDAKAYLSEDDRTVIKIAKKKEKKSAQPFEERERRRWMIAGGIIVSIVIVLIIFFSIAPPIGPGCQGEGDEVDPFDPIGDVDGKVYDLNAKIGQKDLIVLEFFATTCSFCQTMASDLADLHEHYGWGETVEFVSISSSSGDSVQQVRSFRDTYGMGTNMTYIYDSSHSIADDFCVTYTPTTVFIDSNGVIVEWSQGAKNFDQMVNIIDDLLQG
jgi:thioredoxin-related protein